MKGGIPNNSPPLRAALVAAGLGLGLGCGSGIYDGTGTTQVTKTVGRDGDTLVLAQARLLIDPGTLDSPTPVTLRRIPTIAHAGAYGPVFELAVPGTNLFRKDPTFELLVPFIGANQGDLALGSLNPGLSVAQQQWVPISVSQIDANLTMLTAPAQGFSTAATLDFGAVVRCPPTVPCPSGQTCSSNACQACPSSTSCP